MKDVMFYLKFCPRIKDMVSKSNASFSDQIDTSFDIQ